MIYGIFGDCDASPKLVKAALNDQLDTWRNLNDPDDVTFSLVLGVRSPLSIWKTIGEWAEVTGVHVDVYSAQDEEAIQEIVGMLGYDVYHHSTRFMLDVVDRCLQDPHRSTIYALVGEEDPPTDVARALCRATDNGLEVRDLAEAGITYIRTADNPLPTTQEKTLTVAHDDDDDAMGLDEAGALADEGDNDAMEALSEAAGELGLDPDDYETWTLLAEAIAEVAPDDGDDDGESESDDDDDESEQRGGGYPAEEIEEMDLPDIRLLAKSLGVEDYAKARRATLIRSILEAQDAGTAPATSGDDDDDEPAAKPSKAKAAPAVGENDDVLAALAVVGRWLKSL